MLVFAQVAHAFDACAAHLEDTRQNTMIVTSPCVADQICENCAVPIRDVCDSVSELAVLTYAGSYELVPPTMVADAPFIAPFAMRLEACVTSIYERFAPDIPPLQSQTLAPQLSGRAPPFSV